MFSQNHSAKLSQTTAPRPWTSGDPGYFGFGFVVHLTSRNEVNNFLYSLLPHGRYEGAFLQVSLCKSGNVEGSVSCMYSPSARNALFATALEGRKSVLKNSAAVNYTMVCTYRIPREGAEKHPKDIAEIKSLHSDVLKQLGAQYTEISIGDSIDNLELDQSEIGKGFEKLSTGSSSSFAIVPKSCNVTALDALDMISSSSGPAVITQTFLLGDQEQCRTDVLRRNLITAGIPGLIKLRRDSAIQNEIVHEGLETCPLIRSIVVLTLQSDQSFELGDKAEYSITKTEGVHDFSFSVPRNGFDKIRKLGVVIHDRWVDRFLHFRMPYKGNTQSGVIVSSEGGQMALFDIFKSQTDFNLAIAGGPGSGTTHTANEILFHHLSTNGYAICLDSGRGTKKFSELVSGVHIEVSKNGCINPFSLIADTDSYEYEGSLACISELISNLIGVKDDDRPIMQKHIADVFIRIGQTATITDLAIRLNDQGMSHLSQPLTAYAAQGDYQKYFSIQARDIPSEGLVVFDLPFDLSLPDRLKTALHCSLLSLFQQKSRQIPKNTNKMLVHKECSLFLKNLSIVHELERTMRVAHRSRASVVTITRCLLDYFGEAAARPIFDLCSAKIIQAQRAELFSDERIKDFLGVNEEEIEALKQLRVAPGNYVEACLFSYGQMARIKFSTDPIVNSLYGYR